MESFGVVLLEAVEGSLGQVRDMAMNEVGIVIGTSQVFRWSTSGR